MAKLMVKRDQLVLRLTPLEKLADLRLRSPKVPVASVESVHIVDDPSRLMNEVSFGFAGNGAPAQGAMTAFSRGKFRGSRAAVFVYFRGPSLRADIKPGQRWCMFLVSRRSVDDDFAALQDALSSNDA